MTPKAFFIMRLNDHVQYLKKMDAAIRGLSDFPGTDHRHCKLGQWLHGEGREEVVALRNPQAQEIFNSLFEPHERFHALGKEALEKKRLGDEEGAKQALTRLHLFSTILSNKLLQLDDLE